MEVLLLPVLILHAISGCACLWTVEKVTAKLGGSITIPCHYNWRFREQEKYWCRGRMWYTCVRVREWAGRFSVMDNPDELVITLMFSELRVQDAGRYWCAVDISGKSDIRTSLELQVTDGENLGIIHALTLTVSSALLCASEGGIVHVQCLYSDRLKKVEKKWCRGGDLHSCQSQRSAQISQHAQLQLRDEGQGLLSVAYTGLQTDDAGWYWCSAAGVQAPVHICITTTHNYTLHNDTVYSDPPSPSHTSTTTVTHSNTHNPHIHTLHTQTPPSFLRGSTTSSTTSSTSVIPENVFTSPAIVLEYPSNIPESPPIATPTASHRLSVCVIMLLAAVMSVLVGAVCWRCRTHQREAQVREKWAESAKLSVSDDAELLDHDWSRAVVLQLQEESNS
ncbi:CMRF35-like molecule 6 [Pangasianodon hypophthalmus]|uniref:CMRF35-like molecule 6 n=1 Tax=Pangasianodon hypophthalmus TaxID=310915 RepID=UPI0023070A28|nr:CMRF35-like molecule 6 [Pangasianodon hypophthalmus]